MFDPFLSDSLSSISRISVSVFNIGLTTNPYEDQILVFLLSFQHHEIRRHLISSIVDSISNSIVGSSILFKGFELVFQPFYSLFSRLLF
jgi:hypothetical protein